MTKKLCRATIVLFSSLSTIVFSAPPEVDADKDMPRLPAVKPADTLKTFQIKKGFHLELVASEPLILDPIALSFDENGKMFVVEMRDYSERRNEHLGRIQMLEDTDGDGRFDKSTVYAENLAWPTGVICYDGGIFVAATPEIIYLKDTNGDGKADVRKIIYTGFGNTRDRLNVQALLNSFNWGLDNRIHGASAPNGGIVTNLVYTSQKPLDLNNYNFAFNPKTSEMFEESGGGQYGMSFDSNGRKYASSNSRHLMAFMYDAKYAARNPFYVMPAALVDIPVDGPAAEVYRISPEEPWRVIRTKWRVAGIASGPIEGGGRSAGYFTGATGATIYRGDAFPEGFENNAFIGDAGGNLVHRKQISSDGVALKAERPADEQNVEFLASKDTWFRPVQFANAPDGTLYVIDMYRETIEHPWSLPDQLKKHLDLNSGNDMGRIYRIVPDGFKQPKTPKLGKYSTAKLVETLENPNGWHRDTAARLLYQRQDKAAVPALTKLLEKSKSNYGRLHALYALDGLNALTETHILKAFKDVDAAVRENVVKLSEKFFANGIPSSLLKVSLLSLTNDPFINVRYQLAFTAGEIKSADKISILEKIAQRDVMDLWIRAAILSSSADGAGELFARLSQSSFGKSTQQQKFLGELVGIIGAKNQPDEIKLVLEKATAANDAGLSFILIHALSDGLSRTGNSLSSITDQTKIKILFNRAAQQAADSNSDLATRVQAMQLLGSASYQEAGKTLLTLLDSNQNPEIQAAAITALGHFVDPRLAGELLQRWKSFSPKLRQESLSILLSRPERISALLTALEQGPLSHNELSAAQQKLLRNNRDAVIRAKAIAILGVAPVAKRQDVVDAFASVLNLKGDTAHGKTIYMERCASCHRLEGNGFSLGPDLVTVQNSGKEKMMINILDPNREVPPNFQAYEVETKDGETVTGLIASETTGSVTIKQAYGKEQAILRSNILKMQNQGQSLMPEGLESGLSPQDLADLIEYVSTAKSGK